MVSGSKENAPAIGVDLGGSHVSAMLVEPDGRIAHRCEYDVSDVSFGPVFKLLSLAIHDVLQKSKSIAGIGIGSPGNIDPLTGSVRYSPNFGWRNVPLGDELRKTFDVPVFVGNDARCATLGEHAYGSGQGVENFVLMTLGTGLGGGIIGGGVLLLGRGMAAGEFGHHQIRSADGFICSCGKIGCFEAHASGTGLLRHARAVAPSFPRSTLLGNSPYDVGSKAIRKAAEAGDLHALAAWERYIDDLARGIANVIAFVDPEIIALGGGVSAAGEFMLAGLRPKVEAYTTMAPKGLTKLVTATLGNDAGAIGAAVMARRGGLRAS